MNAPNLTPPEPAPLRKQVVDILRAAITDCSFAPGGRLVERELCESLNVSRSTIRECLRQLEAEGLIRIVPNRGPVVATVGETEAREIYDIRAKLEAMASSACAVRGDAALIAALEECLQNMWAAFSERDFAAFQTAKTAFYHGLFDGSGNRQLAVLLKQLRARVTLMRGIDVNREMRMMEGVRGASEVLAAIKAGNPQAAAQASEAHIGRAADLAIKASKQAEEGAASPPGGKRRAGR